jgi:hypothetical protein
MPPERTATELPAIGARLLITRRINLFADVIESHFGGQHNE